MGLSAVVSGILAIFQHHAQAAKQEQELGCVGLNAANNAFSEINAAVQNGTITAAVAAQSLQQVVSSFQSFVAPSSQNNPCNADCEATVLVSAIAIYMESQFQQQAAQAATQAAQEEQTVSEINSANTPAVAAAASPAVTAAPSQVRVTGTSAIGVSLPTWAWVLGIGLAAWAVL
jgi:hypothetical protein